MSTNNNIQTKKELLVKVENLSKKFCKDLKTSLWYGVKDLISGVSGHEGERSLRPKEFWAITDIDFELHRGECLGLIGHNGAGKSTLLKILNGLINPDVGKVSIKGRVGALIELGAGFNPILTGRENIFNNGAILGFSQQEIKSKLNTIISFAELEEFIDMPVQHYSSGMKVRLGFAIAAQMEPDVLIIDEVLAVGDLGFVLKCFKVIDDLLPNTAIIFVSHNMPMVSRVCNKIMLLDKGQVKYSGDDVGKAIDNYYSRFSNNNFKIVFDEGLLKLDTVKLLDESLKDKQKNMVNWGDSLKLYFKFKILKHLHNTPIFKIILFDKEQRPVAVLEENLQNTDNFKVDDAYEFIVSHQNIQLTKGIYTVNILVSRGPIAAPILRVNDILKFQVLHDKDIWPPFLLKSEFKNVKGSNADF